MSAAVASVDIHFLKHRLRATWMAGDYDRFSRFMESSAVEFLDRVAIPPGASLLDVACGSGQLALIAARRGARVTGVDIAANSIGAARDRAQAEALPAQFDEGDAEALPYPDASYRFDYPFSPAGVVDFFREHYGPTNRAFAALTTHDQEALHADLVALWRAHNQSALETRTTVDAEYLQVVAIRSKP